MAERDLWAFCGHHVPAAKMSQLNHFVEKAGARPKLCMCRSHWQRWHVFRNRHCSLSKHFGVRFCQKPKSVQSGTRGRHVLLGEERSHLFPSSHRLSPSQHRYHSQRFANVRELGIVASCVSRAMDDRSRFQRHTCRDGTHSVVSFCAWKVTCAGGHATHVYVRRGQSSRFF